MDADYGHNVIAFHLQNTEKDKPVLRVNCSYVENNDANARISDDVAESHMVLKVSIGERQPTPLKKKILRNIRKKWGILETKKECFEIPSSVSKEEILPTLLNVVDKFQEDWTIDKDPKNVKLFFENFENPTESEEETSASESEEESDSEGELSTSDSEGEIQPSYRDLIVISSDEEEEKNIRSRREKRHHMQDSDFTESDEEGEFQIPVRSKAKRKRH